jgi:hypothetical protein
MVGRSKPGAGRLGSAIGRRTTLAAPEKKRSASREILRRAHRRALGPSIGSEVSRVGLLETGPFTVMAWWEVAPAALAAARRRVGDPEAKIVLRFRDASLIGGAGGGATFDIALEGQRGNYFLKLGASFRSLRSELGVLSEGGRFAALARSNPVQTPPGGESNRYDETFRSLRPAGSPALDVEPEESRGIFGSFGPGPVERFRGDPPVAGIPPSGGPPAGAGPGTRPVGPPPPAVPGGGRGEGPTDRSRPPASSAASGGFGPGPSVGPAPPPSGPLPTAGMSVGEDRPPAAGTAGKTAGKNPGPGSGATPFYAPELAGLMREVGGTEEAPPPAAPPTGLLDESRAPAAAAGPAPEIHLATLPAAPSSFGGASPAPRPPEERVDLELHADVVIYGRTRPGTRVYIGGAHVPVRGDGTFEARFAMPPSPTPHNGTGRMP